MRYVKDIFFTEDFLIKGHVHTGGPRLTTFLNSTTKRFIEIHEATLVSNAEDHRMTTGRLVVRLNEILLAHETLEEAGDEGLKSLIKRDRKQKVVNVYLGGRNPVEVWGKIQQTVYHRDDLGSRDFIVISEPVIHGLSEKKTREHAILKKLSYVIVNRSRIAFMFD